VTLYPEDSADANGLLHDADLAMCRVKRGGRDGFRFFTADLAVECGRRLAVEADLAAALEHGELELHYQPKVSLDDRRPTGTEALVRWRHPRRGLLPPAEFIGAAEELGLMASLGRWVLSAACREAAAWQGIRALTVAVNVSAEQLRHDDLLATATGALGDSGLPAACLELELTESLLVQDLDAAARTVGRLRELGVRVAIDDFGTGYSSLRYLGHLPADALKIDRGFVAGATSDARDACVVRAVIGLGHHLGLRVVAEGIETEDQAAFLTSEGCDEGQGYLFAPPLAASEFARLVGVPAAR
jgi:EAL domain-containing protein (putative c-di-GMP-specific phosphodiesterase class I)